VELPKSCINSARNWYFSYTREVLRLTHSAVLSPSVSDFMSMKKQLLTALLDLPLDVEHCPFCVLAKGNCAKCWYAEHYKPCNHKDGAYQKLRKSIDQFYEAVEGYWESSKEVEPSGKNAQAALQAAQHNLVYWLGNFIQAVSHSTNKLLRASTVDRYMETKQSLMLTIVNSLPLHNTHCPFCLAHTFDCDSCEYAMLYGKCEVANSTFAQLITAKNKILEALRKYWK